MNRSIALTDSERKTIHASHVFKNMCSEEIDALLIQGEVREFGQNELLCAEGELSTFFGIILSGSADITKKNCYGDLEGIATIAVGDPLGDFIFFDETKRSVTASVSSNAGARFWLIDSRVALQFFQSSNDGVTFYQNCGSVVVRRLKEMNQSIIHEIKDKIAALAIQKATAIFLVQIIVLLSLVTVFMFIMEDFATGVRNSSVITVPFMLVMVIVALYMIRRSHLNFYDFGLTLTGWRRSLLESLLFTFIVIVCLIFIKWLFIIAQPDLGHVPLFDPSQRGNVGSTNSRLIITLIGYILIVAPIQEVIVRGLLQGSLQVFITGKHNRLISIVASNLIFATTHLYITYALTLFSFVFGLFWGWLYSRHRTLLGVILSHALIGSTMLLVNFNIVFALT